jgi:ERCC4-type nuclease
MHVVIDTREQQPWTFDGQGFNTMRAKLDAGDYSVFGLEQRVSIERKSLDDWTGTVIRDRKRFYRELERLRGYDFRAVVIEASVREIMAGRYKSQVQPSTVLGFIAEVTIAQAVPVYLAGTRAEAQILAGALLRMAEKKMRVAS